MLSSIEVSLLGRNQIACEGLSRILSGESLKVRASATDILTLQRKLAIAGGVAGPHVIVVEDGPDLSGLELCMRIRDQFANARVVLLADQFDFDHVARAFRSGIDGYIVKELGCEALVQSLRLAVLGEKVFPSELARALTENMPHAASAEWETRVAQAGLSAREVEILRCVMTGMANKVISYELGICEATVKVHIKALLRKLRVTNRTQAAIWAVMNGLERFQPMPRAGRPGTREIAPSLQRFDRAA